MRLKPLNCDSIDQKTPGMRVELTSVDGTKSLRGTGFICADGSLVHKYNRVVQVKNDVFPDGLIRDKIRELVSRTL